jgi:putative NADH-flavin reductase
VAKIALFGATGMIGQRILNEALTRGHQVTAIVRDLSRLSEKRPNLEVKIGDVLKPESVAVAVRGNDVVVSAYGPGKGGDPHNLVTAAEALIEGIGADSEQKGQRIRLIVVGGAGSLEVAPGVQLVDRPDFPAAWKSAALAARDALAIYRASDIDWAYVSPAALIQPGERTGRYRTAKDQLITDAKGESRISAEDYAVAIVDEIEKPQFIRQRYTAAY